MELSFHGAAGGVTGSCALIVAHGKRILVDCGLFQGGADAHDANLGPFGFDPPAIDFVLLTHAHLDHCGRLALLAKRGFHGEILATSATRDLARLVLLDAAGLEEEEAKRNARRQARGGKPTQGPSFTEWDVFDAMDRFGRVASYNQSIALCKGITVTFGDAGHILGSAWIQLEIEEDGARKRLLFSGDVGNHASPLLNPPAPAPAAEFVVMESTYGDRLHKPIGPTVKELQDAVRDTLERGGNVVIPTFALERAQEVLYYLRQMVEAGDLPRRLSVFLDSPMAISATALFRRHPEALSETMRTQIVSGSDPFRFAGLHFTRAGADSMAINQMRSDAVILAGSGMATGGRVLHHLRHNLWRPESSVVFVGYAASGTLARQIIDGQRNVRVFGESIHVAAHIYTIGGFSAHADRDGLLAWVTSAGAPTPIFLVHGEDAPRQTLASRLQGQGHVVNLPLREESYHL
ncbi:MAG TPA: MBL fold metallo-hydrolase [Ktedonobacterales bacterium]|jgi:metallo-beta-lactamase family protein